MGLTFFEKYFSKKNHIRTKQENENLKQLEFLTKALSESEDPPEHTIMDIVVEFNDTSVLGFDKEGVIKFNNATSQNITGVIDPTGKKVFDLIDEHGTRILKEFIDGNKLISSLKVEVVRENESKIYDAVVYRIKNGKTWFIAFFVNCLERAVFKVENCPLKKNCPLNQKCKSKLEI